MTIPDKTRHTPRLFVAYSLGEKAVLSLDGDQAHYLMHVLRKKPGDELRLFNKHDGEWLARIATVSKRAIELVPEKQLREPQTGADLWLCAAPIKKAHFDYMIEKATELGVALFQPILTERTHIREVNIERARTIMMEAAEQSDRLDIPEIQKPMTLTALISGWPADRIPIICAEWGEASPVHEVFAKPQIKNAGKVGIVTGPEGGFSALELKALRDLTDAVFVRLGPRILRADTAAIAALTLWQALCGDWAAEVKDSGY